MRFLLLIGILTCAIQCFAQRENKPKPLSWGIEAGLNLSAPENSKVKSGFNAGLIGELDLSKHWFLETAIKVSLQPWEYRSVSYSDATGSNPEWNIVHKGKPYILNIPIRGGYSIDLSRSAIFRASLGPYIGIGLAGKGLRQEWDIIAGDYKENINDVFKGDYNIKMNRFIIGGSARLGVEWYKHYLFSIDYSLQFNKSSLKLYPPFNSQVVALNFGYKF